MFSAVLLSILVGAFTVKAVRNIRQELTRLRAGERWSWWPLPAPLMVLFNVGVILVGLLGVVLLVHGLIGGLYPRGGTYGDPDCLGCGR